jgi:hypothetical protein
MAWAASAGRILVSAFLGTVAAIFLLIAVALPFTLRSQAAQDRDYYRQFYEAAVYVDRYAAEHQGRLPDDEIIRNLGDQGNARAIWFSLSTGGGECEGSFQKHSGDRFVLWFWRGEWGECFAYPSGKTTLPMSVSAYLRSGLGIEWAAWLLIAIAAGYGSVRIVRRKDRSWTD